MTQLGECLVGDFLDVAMYRIFIDSAISPPPPTAKPIYYLKLKENLIDLQLALPNHDAILFVQEVYPRSLPQKCKNP